MANRPAWLSVWLLIIADNILHIGINAAAAEVVMKSLDELERERLEKRGTPGKWRWYNGCSWWRLGLADDQSKDGAVVRPTVDRDGQPNLVVSQSDMDLIAALRNAAPALLLAARALEQYTQRGHHDTCSHALSIEYPCDCGFTWGKAALAALDGTPEGSAKEDGR